MLSFRTSLDDLYAEAAKRKPLVNPENTDNTNTSNDNSQEEEEKKKVIEDKYMNNSFWSQLKSLDAPPVNSSLSNHSSTHDKYLGQNRPGSLSRAGKGKLKSNSGGR